MTIDFTKFGAFGQADVSVTLKGAEWTAILARITGRVMSSDGAKIYRDAAASLGKQLTDASDKLTADTFQTASIDVRK